MSEPEPELGLGIVATVDRSRISVKFPATGEQRIYAVGTPVLKRVQFRAGETVSTRAGKTVTVESVEDVGGLLTYIGKGGSAREDEISDVTSVSSPLERLLAGQVDKGEVFDLRLRALEAQLRFRQSNVRGFLGGRLELIPHQIFILQEVASRQIPRVLLADEVGLGKTIEACLILQRLLSIGKASRVLILVPESLTHQWFVELLRRFNLWFSIFDEARCVAVEQSDPGENPFLSSQLALCSLSFLSENEPRGAQALEAGWDIVLVDEAHHLEWSPDDPSPEYELVEKFSRRVPGLLLLTATPTQLGLTGHFARLRLLDPYRYDDYDEFLEEAERYGAVAEVVDRILEEKPLKPKDQTSLKKIFNKDPARLAQYLDALAQGKPNARAELIKSLLDQHGTGRVVFRNTRAAMTGFPKRKFCPAPLANDNATLSARVSREVQAEETGEDASIRYSFKDDPRLDWLVNFLKTNRTAKILLICKSQRKVAAIEAALQEKMSAKVALFHEGLPLVQRDRNAAWFAEAEGAQLLLCSEIGSEGRNFQFAHHLVLFDLPLNPGLLEQRIGRLDRIGQTETIRIHVPYLKSSAEEFVLEWYHNGLDAIEHSLLGGNDFQDKFKTRLLELAVAYGESSKKVGPEQLRAFVEETKEFRKGLALKMRKGRDRLLELNSFSPEIAQRVIERVRAADADPFLKNFMGEMLDHFGVRIKEHEEGDVFYDPSHAYVEAFPSIPAEGLLATYDRRRAITREDIRFVSADHSLVRDAIDLLLSSKAGTVAFGTYLADTSNLLLEAIFVLETVADTRWHVDQFLAPTPVRVVVDLLDRDLTGEHATAVFADDVEDEEIQPFLERPEFNVQLLKKLIDSATERADEKSNALRAEAQARAKAVLSADLQRLVDLQKLNDHVRPEEIALVKEQLERIGEAIGRARLRLDALRLVVQQPANNSRRR